jgi:putative transposase
MRCSNDRAVSAAGATKSWGAKVRASFLGSDRTYGARRVLWHDLLAEGVCCGTAAIARPTPRPQGELRYLPRVRS